MCPISNCVGPIQCRYLYHYVRERAHISAVVSSFPFQHVVCIKQTLLYVLCVVLEVNYFDIEIEIFSERAIFTFPTVVLCGLRQSARVKALAVHAKVQT